MNHNQSANYPNNTKEETLEQTADTKVERATRPSDRRELQSALDKNEVLIF